MLSGPTSTPNGTGPDVPDSASPLTTIGNRPSTRRARVPRQRPTPKPQRGRILLGQDSATPQIQGAVPLLTSETISVGSNRVDDRISKLLPVVDGIEANFAVWV